MAVTMVIGNNPQAKWSLFEPHYTMAAVIANEFREAVEDLHLHALVEIGLVLFLMTLVINTGSRVLIWNMTRDRRPRVRAGVASEESA
jgi:phosphate transport system permease protein